uniref:Ig-like domain-containing protein n=1 Tax=Gouania willdenowi TaxID=441366 RepID=A0A8C5HG46_GOUWI
MQGAGQPRGATYDSYSLTVADINEDLTIKCNISGRDPSLFYWYKMNFGSIVKKIVSAKFGVIKLEERNNARYNVTKVDDVYSLTIRNVSEADEGTYFCQGGTSFYIEIISSTQVIVEGKMSTAHLKQSPAEKWVHLGDSVTLWCSLVSMCRESADQCPSKHRVHWFRPGSQSQPGIIYNVSGYEQNNKMCLYRFSKTIGDQSEAGTYYCAVATCGGILFGDGTKVTIKQELTLVIVCGTLLICSVLLNIALIITRKKTIHSVHREKNAFLSNKNTLVSHTAIQDAKGVEINYVALDFSKRKTKRGKTRREVTEECIYSNTRN